MMLLPGISQLQSALLGAAAGALLSGGVVGVAVHKFDSGRYERLVAAQARAQTNAVSAAMGKQKSIDTKNAAAAIAEANAQQRIVTQTITLTRKVPVYVTAHQDATVCVTFGLVRVFVAAARGTDPASLNLPSGESDDACTGLAISDVASTVAEAYGTSRQNSEQLDALIAAVKANDAVK